jgi:raffinose/stachyose/melibiose transport system permease protein
MTASELVAAGSDSAARLPRTRVREGRRDWVTIWLFILPALVLFVLLVLIPMVFALYTSLYDWNGFGGLPSEFVGLDNFTRMFGDDIFIGDLARGGLIIGLSLVLQLPMSLGIALLLNQRLPGRALFRLVFFAPFVLSEAITGALFLMIFSPETGLANYILRAVGLGAWQSTWLADPSIVMYVLFFVITWKYFGFHMILYLAGRQGIPNELLEAASIDGAGTWNAFRYVTLPLLGPTIRLTIFLSVIGALQLFDLVWLLTQGGPVSKSETMAVTMYNYGFVRYEVGYASAISLMMFFLSLVFALGYQRFVMRRDTEGAITGMRDRR